MDNNQADNTVILATAAVIVVSAVTFAVAMKRRLKKTVEMKNRIDELEADHAARMEELAQKNPAN